MKDLVHYKLVYCFALGEVLITVLSAGKLVSQARRKASRETLREFVMSMLDCGFTVDVTCIP